VLQTCTKRIIPIPLVTIQNIFRYTDLPPSLSTPAQDSHTHAHTETDQTRPDYQKTKIPFSSSVSYSLAALLFYLDWRSGLTSATGETDEIAVWVSSGSILDLGSRWFVTLFVSMSGGTPTGAGYMRQRHSQGYASSGDDLEDDACSVMRTSSPRSPRVWSRIEIVENVLWLASAAFIVYYGDRKSNLIYLFWHDDRIRRLPLYLGTVGVVLLRFVANMEFLDPSSSAIRFRQLKVKVIENGHPRACQQEQGTQIVIIRSY
ncbi:hypothetical protein Prudu_020675, partial [Prunus dulcis]